MTLEPEEKLAGRLFRQTVTVELNKLNARAVPDFVPPPLIAVYRHSCPARSELSTALELREVYVPSPRMVVETDDAGMSTAHFWDDYRVDPDVDSWHVPAGRFGFVYREGRCRHCRKLARSEDGRIVDALLRPPITGVIVE